MGQPMEAHLSAHLDNLNLPAEAREWVLDLWRAIQVIDDAYDGERNSDAEDAAFALFVRMPMNPFWVANQVSLVPVLALAVIKWRAANSAESSGNADARSFMWRAAFYDVLAMVCHLCGRDPVTALGLYGEDFAEYRDEFHA